MKVIVGIWLGASVACAILCGCTKPQPLSAPRAVESPPTPEVVAKPEPASDNSVVEHVPNSSPEFKSALARATERREIKSEWHDNLVAAREGFPLIEVAQQGEIAKWNKIRLNTHGVDLDGFRFKTGDSRCEMVWAFGMPEKTLSTWSIEWTGESSGPKFFDFTYKRNLELPGAELPERNTFIFQHLKRTALLPETEYIIWFTFQVKEPVDVYVKMKLYPIKGRMSVHPDTPHSFAQHLDIPLPFGFTAAATMEDHGIEAFELLGLGGAVEWMDKRFPGKRDCPGDAFYIVKAHQYATELATSGQREKANPYFLRVAQMIRDHREEYGELTGSLQAELPNILYNEACTLAVTGQPEKALESLREAVAAGFNDALQLRVDEFADLKSIRDLPGFAEIVKPITAAAPQAP